MARSPRERLVRRRTRAGVIAGLVLALNVTLLPSAVAFGPDDPRTAVDLADLQETDAVPVDEELTDELDELSGSAATEPQKTYAPAAVAEVPAATGTKAVDNLAAGATAEVAKAADGSMSIGVGAPAGATPAQVDALEGQWSVATASEDETAASGAQGFMLAVDAPDTATGDAVVSLDVTKLAETYSAQWLDRLSFTLMPACYATTPEVEACSTGIPVTTAVERTGDTVTVPLEAGDSSGSEADTGEDTATDEVVGDTATSAQVPETLVNVTLDTADLQSVSAAASTASTAVSKGDDSSVSSAVWHGGRAADAIRQIATSTGGGLLVGSSYGAGSGGDFGASPIVSAGSWTAGGSAGAFTYGYTMAAPQVSAGPSPNVSLSYSSQTSDGRTSSTNNQVSWVGEGWDYNPGSITRTFVGCAADTADANNKDHFTGDQCWGSYNAVLSLNGTTTELVRDDTTKQWKSARGDNLRIELLTEDDYKAVIGKDADGKDITYSSNNGDNNGEFWRVTTDDGTQYFFGLNRLPGWSSGKPETKSVLNVPVAGNHSSDPCYAAKFENSFCDQGWRFQLDYVVDTTGNAMSLWWEKEKNAYARNMKETPAVSYDRAGYLSHIDYGQRAESLYSAEPLGRMLFTARERCFDDPALNVECSDANFDSKQSDRTRPWFDTPADLACATGKKCSTYAPTFWSRKRLASIDACAQREQGVRLTEYTSDADGNESGSRNACGLEGDSATTTLLSKVDSWGLKQSFPWNLTGEYTALWLEAITRTGYAVDGGTDRLNPVSFGHNEKALPNRVRVNSADTDPLFARLRIQDVVSEYGGRTHVDYKAPEDKCLTGAARPAVDKNKQLCYPAYWHADGELEDKRISWFHKYVVDKITEFPRLADSQEIVTQYSYDTFGDEYDGALWAKSQSEFSRPKKRTWDDWRGYPIVTTITGTTDAVGGSTASKSVTRYFRGMSDDVIADDTPEKASDDVKRSYTLYDVTGTALKTDLRAYAGMVAESLTYSGTGDATATGWISRTVNIPDDPVRLATRNRTDGPDVVSERVTLGATKTITKASGKGADASTLRTVTTETEYDPTYGLPTKVHEYGDAAAAGDESCTATSYVHNTSGTNYLVGLVARTVTTSGASTCSTDLSSATGSTLVSASRMYYDGAASSTATPTKGLVTRTEAPTGAGTAWETASPESRTEYDSVGRVVKVTDPTGLYNTTTYTPSSGQVYKIDTVTASKVVDGVETGFADSTTLEPGRGATIRTTDANNRVTSYEYDPLGRAVAAWDATQAATDDPTVRYSYNIDLKKPVSVVTESLSDNPTAAAGDGKYEASTTIYDGLGRERQTQTPAVGGGRLITDTLHNSSGQVRYTRNAYYMEGDPGADLIVPDSESLVPNATSYTYDGLGRVLTVTPVLNSYPQTGESFTNAGKTVTTTDRRTRYEYALDYTVVRQPKGTPASRVWTDTLGRTVRQDTFSDTSLTEAGAISTTYAYDLRGDMVTSTDDVGNTRTWKYDALGRVTDTTDPDAGATHTDYDAYGRVDKATDARGQTVSYGYERLNRVEQVKVTPKGSTTATLAQTYAYDGATGGKGQLSSATRYTDAKAYTTTIEGYTADYQPTAMTTALPPGSTAGLTADGFATQYRYTYAYNDDGQLETYTTPAAGGLSAEAVITRYNEAGLPTSVSGQDWYAAETSYSPYGQVLRATVGEQGHRLWQDNTFNESTGELLTSTLVRENATDTTVVPSYGVSSRAYAYDPSGNVLSVKDKAGTVTDQQCFTYDTLGQLKEAWTTPGGGACAASGKTTAEPVYSDGTINVSSNNSGYWQSYDYDALGNRTKKTAYKADPTITSGVRDTKGDVVTDYLYGTNTSDTVKNDQPHTLTSYTTTSTTAAGATVKARSTQTYDTAGELETRGVSGDTAQGLTWTWDGKVESVTGFGADGSGAWVGAGAMCLDLANGDPTAGTAVQIYTCNGSKPQNFRIQPADTNNDGTVEDATIGQLVVGGRCAQPNGTAAASPVLVQACDTTVAAQRWQTLSTGQIKHVATGLCLSTPAATAGADLTLVACNSTVATQLWKPASKTTYVYDAMGNRLLERTSAGAVLNLPDTKVSLTTTGAVRYAERTYAGAGGPAVTRYREGSATTSGVSEHLFAQATDLNGTPLAEVRLDGGMTVRTAKKDPWGEDRAANLSPRSHTGFHTGDDDAETGLVHLGAREYDPGTGRFLSADPVLDDSDPLQANGYSYANNNPVTHSDPSGLTSSASSFDASIAALDAKIAEYQKSLSRSIGDVILATGWAVFKEFIGWNDVVGCFSQGDLWACGSLLMDAIPWTSIFSKGKKMWRAFEGTLSAVKAYRVAKRVAEVGLKAARAAKTALLKAKKAAEVAAAEAKRKAREAAKAAAAAVRKKAHTGSKGARGNPVQVKAGRSAQSKGTSGGGKAENKSGGSRSGSGKEESGGSGGGEGGSCPVNAPPNSFTPDTKVLMADGSAKAIKDVKAGDKVLATDPETGETRAQTVTAEILGKGVKHLVKVTIDTDGKKGTKTAEVTATDKHPFWVPELGDWIDATDLKAGEWLRTSAGTLVEITAVKRWTALDATVHNLTVSMVHTYYVLAGATPVLVHNCGTETRGPNTYSWEHEESDSLFEAEVDENGTMTMLAGVTKESPVRGIELFNRALDHFGDRVTSINGNLIEENRATFNALTGGGMSPEQAILQTWTGKLATRSGFGVLQSLKLIGEPGNFSKVEPIFTRS
ncbi:polymorphic toxin-type HINT domain-containing protein [Streptomyces sp. NBC_01275]|uniref:polymorphic toxin-type HINT domain-containing protein n=1 Tax=Streptomyces sp. NBC_01275 TaxID=2903807 RepID=UPI002254D583|nr:polymorphic toxin-type HINT domain-containing protein [Streptomyces sp. NBC_01275]MCX4763981.1 polymorphic toxin-type HINT domain-containing protein [Streptomyces sp. NBC_01275]